MPANSVEALIFDPTAIEKIRAVAGDQGSTFVAEMAQLFLDEATKAIEDLRHASERSDWKAVARVSHSLKSSAATLGLMRLADACKALELDTKSATASPDTPGLVAGVLDRFESASPILRTLL
jgi:HPt (histidine-containing phosphotransfer) domain-containing protein